MTQTKHTLFIALIAGLVLARCSSEGGDEQSQQLQEQVNGANSLNQQENASLNGNQQQGNAAQGEAMNNAVENNFSNANENYLNQNATGENEVVVNNFATNPLLNQSANAEAFPVNQSAPINELPMNNVASMPLNEAPLNAAPFNATTMNSAPLEGAPVNSAAMAAPPPEQTAPAPTANWEKMNASPFANPQMNWPGRGKVKYITRKVTRHASPDGPVVGEFNVGNHPLVYQNGNWVELSNGTYVKGNSTSDRPVGYKRSHGNLAH